MKTYSYSDLSAVCDRRAVNGVVQSMPPRSALSLHFTVYHIDLVKFNEIK